MNRKTTTALLALTLAASACVNATPSATALKAGANGGVVGMIKSGSGKVSGAVVSLTEVPGSYRAPSSPVTMDQKDKDFVPRVLAIMKGTTVRFENSDPFSHNVFSNSRVQTFNVSQTKKGDFTDVKFDHPGIVPIKCHIHANMKAYIVVLSNPFFGVTNGSGIFHISGVPAGTYTMKIWTEAGSTTQAVNVPSSGDAKVVIQI